MTRLERLLLLAFFAAVLAVLAGVEPEATAVGGVAGAGAGVLAAARTRKLRARIDARLGADDARPTGFRPRRPLLHAGALLLVLAGLFVTTAFVPFVGRALYAGSAAAATALPLVLTAARLRR